MRILHVIPTYAPAWCYGGTVFALLSLCRGLIGRGHEVCVYTSNLNGDSLLNVPCGREQNVEETKVTYFPLSFPQRLYASASLETALRERVRDFDLIHLHSVFLFPTHYGAREAQKAGIPYVLTPHGMLDPTLFRTHGFFRKHLWLKFFGRQIIRQAAALHVTTDLEAGHVRNVVPQHPELNVIPFGIDPNFFAESQEEVSLDIRRAAGCPYVLYLGRLNWKKRVNQVILAAMKIPGLRVIVAGQDDGDYEHSLKRIVREHGVEDRVLFLGPVYGEEKKYLFRHAEAFVLPSVSENFGVVVAEALTQGCPVITTPGVGLSGIVSESKSGFVCSGEAEEIRGCIERLRVSVREGRIDRDKIAANARFVFDENQTARDMETLYKRVCRV